jgi:hypothetical protein
VRQLLRAGNSLLTLLEVLCFRSTWQRRWLLWHALVAVLLASIAMRCLHFARIARWLGNYGGETAAQSPPRGDQLAIDIGWAVSAVAKRVPWPAKCLIQAVAATLLNRLHGVSSTLYLGVSLSPEMQAHAWVRCGRRVITGSAEHHRFTVVGTFAQAFDRDRLRCAPTASR